MNDYKGIIIEESLKNKNILKKIKILATEVEKVTKEHRTPWLAQWTMHTVEIPENEVQDLAEEISASLDNAHNSAWYADYKNETHHYIIFHDKIFCVDRTSRKQYDEAKQHGISLGIPEYQVDFHPDLEEWKRQ